MKHIPPAPVWRLLLSLTLFLAVTCAAQSGSDSVPSAKDSDSTGFRVFARKVGYVGAKLAYDYHDSLQAASFSFYGEIPLTGDWLTAGFGVGYSLMHTPNQKRYWYPASDLLFVAAWALPRFLAEQVYGDSSATSRTVGWIISPLLFPLIHPRITIKPIDWFGVWVGYDAAYSLFWAEDGIWFEPQVGVEFRSRSVLGVEIAVSHHSFWSWEQRSRSYGWGVHAAISFDVMKVNEDNP